VNPVDEVSDLPDKFTRVPTGLKGVTLILPAIFRDNRGFFLEYYNRKEFAKFGITTTFVQDNHSCSGKGVIRGLHFQEKYPQEKLVRVVRGSIFDVVVDIRKGSPTFGHWIGMVLSACDVRMIHIPVGFAHGFLSLEENSHVIYKVSEIYYPEFDRGVVWNDQDIGVKWPLKEYGIKSAFVSDKDAQLPVLREISDSL
jgi:dTDP-4-dehydrorhamnose 3,5-epimerase